MVKAKELWASLSKDEPGNQARPQNLEQLIVLLTRETARRIVHLINHTSTHVSNLPQTITRTTRGVSKQFLNIANALVKVILLDNYYLQNTSSKMYIRKPRAVNNGHYNQSASLSEQALYNVSLLHMIILGFIQKVHNNF